MLPKQNPQPESLKFNYKGAAEPSLSFESEKSCLKKKTNKNKTTQPNLFASVYTGPVNYI